ncbi:MAG: YceD family protein [Candidatus Kryptoniota bacterium]
MRINISNLSEGTHEYEFEESPSNVKLDERFSKQISVKVELEKRRRQLFLTGHVKTSGKFVCDRCLAEFEKDVSVDYRMTYVQDQDDAGEVDEDEITVIHRSTNEIDIDEEIRESILVSVPLKLLCKEDCAGLCASCGKNLNDGTCACNYNEADPRWEILMKSQISKVKSKD